MDERHVKEPEREEDRQVGQAEQDQEGKAEAGVATDEERGVGGVQPEETGEAHEGGQVPALGGAHRVQEEGGGEQPVASEERSPLEHDHEERDRVDEAKEAEKDEAGQPIARHGLTLVA